MSTWSLPTALRVEVLVVGGGLGGVSAAHAAARNGRTVVLTEEVAWLGGQLTSQGVPPDEHPWMEQFGCTAAYRSLRDGIRAYYRRWYPLTEEARASRWLNPGAGQVSRLCAEPRAGVAVVDGMLAPHRASGRLTVLQPFRPVAADVDGDRVGAVTLERTHDGARVTVAADYVIDATETGALLPLTGTEYVTGFESTTDTGEPSAPHEAQPLNMQAVTVCVAFEHREGEDHTVDRPVGYDFWRSYRPPFWPGPQLGWVAPHPRTLEPREHSFVPHPESHPERVEPGKVNLWRWRRLLARHNLVPGTVDSDVVLANWPLIDYLEGPIFEVPDDEAARHLEAAREQARCLFYWMQTEAPRSDGGTGHPGLRLRPDVLGTDDGLAMAPYVRESRRIRAQRTVVEQDLSLEVRGDAGAVNHPDSVGVGMYPIDLHPSTGGDNYLDMSICPFQIPLGALLPVRVRNLLPGAKNLGTTHITNGAYRMHPTEWNVGEAAGLLAHHCVAGGVEPHQVASSPDHLRSYQGLLDREGVERAWPDLRGF